jgi:hypothetical protein
MEHAFDYLDAPAAGVGQGRADALCRQSRKAGIAAVAEVVAAAKSRLLPLRGEAMMPTNI